MAADIRSVVVEEPVIITVSYGICRNAKVCGGIFVPAKKWSTESLAMYVVFGIVEFRPFSS